MLPTLAGVEPTTSWSPVGRRIQLSHRGRLFLQENVCCGYSVKSSWQGKHCTSTDWNCLTNKSTHKICFCGEINKILDTIRSDNIIMLLYKDKILCHYHFWADNSVKNWWNLQMSNPKADLHSINANIKFGETQLRFTPSYCPESKIWMYCGR